MKPYCTQNDGNCPTCSLINYNRDCQNKPIHGGYRPGAGRKPTGRKKQVLYITENEHAKIKELLNKMRTAE
jgi:hypothetical protein